MPDIFYLISKWWKQVLLVVLLSLLVVGTIVFLQPSQYLSVTTAVRASTELSDKARIFNKNIQYLYPSLGSPDALDIILGTARLDTVYLAIAIDFNLWDHYKITGDKERFVYKAADELKENTRVIRSEYGELKVKVWDTDKNLAPKLANAVMDQLNTIHRELQMENNQVVLNSLLASREKLKKEIDSIVSIQTLPVKETGAYTSGLQVLAGQLDEYQKLIGEYQVTIDTNPDVLMIVEKARPSVNPDKPRRLMILVATTFLSFCFALATILVAERRKKAMP